MVHEKTTKTSSFQSLSQALISLQWHTQNTHNKGSKVICALTRIMRLRQHLLIWLLVLLPRENTIDVDITIHEDNGSLPIDCNTEIQGKNERSFCWIQESNWLGCEINLYAAGGLFDQNKMKWKMKKAEKWPKPWQMGTHLRVLDESFPMNTKVIGFRWFSKIFEFLCLRQK